LLRRIGSRIGHFAVRRNGAAWIACALPDASWRSISLFRQRML
jgi:hypothetical protein